MPADAASATATGARVPRSASQQTTKTPRRDDLRAYRGKRLTSVPWCGGLPTLIASVRPGVPLQGTASHRFPFLLDTVPAGLLAQPSRKCNARRRMAPA